jgi:pyruvate ferredoxin oxidoreductase gamma subunit
MREIRWHGRGGQGAKTVSQLLAMALLEAGDYVQAFPEYGPERSGAPVQAYTRSDQKIIRRHCGVTDPDIVVVLDATLMNELNVTAGLKPDGLALINTTATPEQLADRLNYEGRIICFDAEEVAHKANVKYANVVMVGALAALMGEPSLEILKATASEKLGKKLPEKVVKNNLEAIELGYQNVLDTSNRSMYA